MFISSVTYEELTPKKKEQEWIEIEDLVLCYQKQFQEDYKNDANVIYEAENAALELLSRFYPLLKKYYLIVTTGSINWSDKESKDFVGNFINDRNLLNALHRKNQTAEYRRAIYDSFNFVKETYGNNDEHDIMTDLQMLFLVVAKRYKQVGKNFCAYVTNSYKFELARHIKKYYQNPLNVTYKISEYTEGALKDDSTETYEDEYYDDGTGVPSLEWINGYCGEAFQELSTIERKILVKYYLENLNDNQIAKELGLHLNTINSKRRKSVAKLCEFYGVDPSTIKRSRKSGKNAVVMTKY